MFRTHESTGMNFHGIFGEGYRQWLMVERCLHSPWFLVSISSSMKDDESSIVLMPGDESMLEQVLSQESATVQVTDIQVVTPSWMNGQERWVMERLIKLKAGVDESGCLIYLISVEGGTVYSGHHGMRPMDTNLSGSRVIYCRE